MQVRRSPAMAIVLHMLMCVFLAPGPAAVILQAAGDVHVQPDRDEHLAGVRLSQAPAAGFAQDPS